MNLNRILSRRLAQTNVRQAHGGRRGEAIALLLTERALPLLTTIVEATRSASPHSVTSVRIAADSDTSDAASVESALAMLDDQLADHGTVILAADINDENLSLFLEHMDRIVAVGPASSLGAKGRSDTALSSLRADHSMEVIAISASSPSRPEAPSDRVLRQLDLREPATADRDIAWLGRHLSRTKLGLALGAGGAKGYAHVGALHVLQSAGYTVDYVAGSSIGAMVGAWLAMGMDAAEIERTMRGAFSPDNVEAMFKISMAGMSTGLDVHTRMCRETTQDCTFSELQIPLVAMAVDLTTREPAPITDGPVWEALLASTALAGMFPPVERGNQRLVDGLALVPVPTQSVTELGADITLSVNIMSRETLDAWPGQLPPDPAPARRGSRMLDTLLEVMDLAQLDSSIRHAALADVVLTPRFGPASWRDFHLADLFLAAGRQIAEEHLASLQSLARPQISIPYKGAVHGAAVHV